MKIKRLLAALIFALSFATVMAVAVTASAASDDPRQEVGIVGMNSTAFMSDDGNYLRFSVFFDSNHDAFPRPEDYFSETLTAKMGDNLLLNGNPLEYSEQGWQIKYHFNVLRDWDVNGENAAKGYAHNRSITFNVSMDSLNYDGTDKIVLKKGLPVWWTDAGETVQTLDKDYEFVYKPSVNSYANDGKHRAYGQFICTDKRFALDPVSFVSIPSNGFYGGGIALYFDKPAGNNSQVLNASPGEFAYRGFGSVLYDGESIGFSQGFDLNKFPLIYAPRDCRKGYPEIENTDEDDEGNPVQYAVPKLYEVFLGLKTDNIFELMGSSDKVITIEKGFPLYEGYNLSKDLNFKWISDRWCLVDDFGLAEDEDGDYLYETSGINLKVWFDSIWCGTDGCTAGRDNVWKGEQALAWGTGLDQNFQNNANFNVGAQEEAAAHIYFEIGSDKYASNHNGNSLTVHMNSEHKTTNTVMSIMFDNYQSVSDGLSAGKEIKLVLKKGMTSPAGMLKRDYVFVLTAAGDGESASWLLEKDEVTAAVLSGEFEGNSESDRFEVYELEQIRLPDMLDVNVGSGEENVSMAVEWDKNVFDELGEWQITGTLIYNDKYFKEPAPVIVYVNVVKPKIARIDYPTENGNFAITASYGSQAALPQFISAVTEKGTVVSLSATWTPADEVAVNAGTYEYKVEVSLANDAHGYELSSNLEQNVLQKTYTIKIEKAKITVKAKDAAKNYYAENPVLETELVSGELFYGDEISDIVNIATTAQKTSNAGAYAITLTMNDENDNYDVTAENGTLTVKKIDISLQIKDVTVDFGAAMPAFEYEIAAGEFAGDDTLESVCAINWSCSAQDTSREGVFDIMASAQADNYNITFRLGTLTVNAAPADNKSDKKKGCKSGLSAEGGFMWLTFIALAALAVVAKKMRRKIR